jgi:hypothetical protein
MATASEDRWPAAPANAAATRLSGTPRSPWSGVSPDVVSYLRGFGLTLAELQPRQLAMFVAARNLAEQVEGLDLPVASNASQGSESTLVEQEEPPGLTAYQRDLTDDQLPADEMEVTSIHAVEDLARILPTQWVLEQVWPEAFYAKLAGRELLMPQWRLPTRGTHGPREDCPDRELVDRQATPDTVRQHAYVLLDTSRSMNDHDRRGTVARGLALAFLRKGYENGSRLHFRPFAGTVGELSSGRREEEFHALVRRIIDLPHAGQTKIQAALQQAVDDIRQGGKFLRADILLITDGMSRLAERPLGEERLHTFLVGDLPELRDSAGPVAVLRSWSRTFRRILQQGFAEILRPTLQDAVAASTLLETLLADPFPGATPAGALDRVLANVQALLADLKRSLGKAASLPPELQRIERQLHDARSLVAEAQSRADTGVHSAGNRGGGRLGLVKLNPWAFLKRLVQRIWRLFVPNRN